MFCETRYALNGDLHVAYRTSSEGQRDIVFVPNWFTHPIWHVEEMTRI
jgi:hypothetical protein